MSIEMSRLSDQHRQGDEQLENIRQDAKVNRPIADAIPSPSLAAIAQSVGPDEACNLILAKIMNTEGPLPSNHEVVYRALLKDCLTKGPGLSVRELSQICGIALTAATTSAASRFVSKRKDHYGSLLMTSNKSSVRDTVLGRVQFSGTVYLSSIESTRIRAQKIYQIRSHAYSHISPRG